MLKFTIKLMFLMLPLSIYSAPKKVVQELKSITCGCYNFLGTELLTCLDIYSDATFNKFINEQKVTNCKEKMLRQEAQLENKAKNHSNLQIKTNKSINSASCSCNKSLKSYYISCDIVLIDTKGNIETKKDFFNELDMLDKETCENAASNTESNLLN